MASRHRKCKVGRQRELPRIIQGGGDRDREECPCTSASQTLLQQEHGRHIPRSLMMMLNWRSWCSLQVTQMGVRRAVRGISSWLEEQCLSLSQGVTLSPCSADPVFFPCGWSLASPKREMRGCREDGCSQVPGSFSLGALLRVCRDPVTRQPYLHSTWAKSPLSGWLLETSLQRLFWEGPSNRINLS